MNYELVKQLKDAGFSQKGLGSAIFPDDAPLKDERQLVYIPTLSELIEACGDGFYGLYSEHWKPVKPGEEWCAWNNHSNLDIMIFGATPEEAVAKLWLFLNKKQ